MTGYEYGRYWYPAFENLLKLNVFKRSHHDNGMPMAPRKDMESIGITYHKGNQQLSENQRQLLISMAGPNAKFILAVMKVKKEHALEQASKTGKVLCEDGCSDSRTED